MPGGTARFVVPSPLDRLAAWERVHPRLFLGILCGVGLVLRLRGYSTRPLWFDEAEQYAIATGTGLAEVLRRLNVLDRNPPGYSIVLHYVAAALGRSEAVLRLPSLLGGTGAIVLAWVVGRCWLGRAAGIGLALLAMVLPTWVFYAREARPYATGLLLILALMHAVALRVRRPGGATTVYLLGAAVATVLWQYASVFVVLAALAAGASWELHARGRTRSGARFWLVSAGLVAAVTVAGVVAFQLPQMKSNGVKSAFFLQHFFTWKRPLEALGFIGSRLGEYLEYLAAGTELGWPGRIVCCVGWMPVLAAIVWVGHGSAPARAILWFAGLPVLALLLLAGFQVHPFGPIRHCLPLAPGILLLLAAGWTRLRRRGHRWAADVSLAALMGLALWSDATVIPLWHDHDLKGLLAEAGRKMRDGDGVVFSVMAGSVYRYYEADLPLDTRGLMYCDAVKQARAGVAPEWAGLREVDFDGLLSRSLGDCPRFWFISIHEDPGPIEKLLARHAHKVEDLDRLHARGSLWIREAVRTATRESTSLSR